jgi:hypothetical protein
MPFDLVIDEQTADGQEARVSKSSVAGTWGAVCGNLRFFADRFGVPRAGIEGTTLPLEVVREHAAWGPPKLEVSGPRKHQRLMAFRKLTYFGFELETGAEEIDGEFPANLAEQAREALVTALLDGGFVPVVAPLASDDAGVVYNVNADEIASALARGLGVQRLVVASNIPGVLDAEGRVIDELDVSEARALIRDGVVTGGMQVKLEAALAAIAAGVGSIQVIDGTSPGTVARTVIAGAIRGTTIVADRGHKTG